MERRVVIQQSDHFPQKKKNIVPASPVGEADIHVRKGSNRALCGLMLGLSVVAGRPASAQVDGLKLGAPGYYEAPDVNVLVFSNWCDGLFADAKISGVELIQQGGSGLFDAYAQKPSVEYSKRGSIAFGALRRSKILDSP